GKDAIAQPYENPSNPWWAVTYDLTYLAFLGVQYYMMADMAVTVLKTLGQGAIWLKNNIGEMAGKLRDWVNQLGDDTSPLSNAGEPAESINVDVDVDVDVDIDVDVDVDVDVDIDVDIDIDVDVDFFAVVDVDVDVDIDVDVVT